MNSTLVIGNKNYSSWSLRSWIILKKLNLDFEEIVVPLFHGDYHEQLKRYSEPALVPVYIENDTTVWDSLAIAEYLAEKHPLLWPTDRSQRAHARSICAEMHSGFVTIRSALPMNCRARNRTPDRSDALDAEIQRIDAIWSQCRSRYTDANDPADQLWLFGQFSIADAMFAPVVSRFRTYAIDEISEVSKNYIDAVLDDPHMREWYAAAEQEKWTIKASEVG